MSHAFSLSPSPAVTVTLSTQRSLCHPQIWCVKSVPMSCSYDDCAPTPVKASFSLRAVSPNNKSLGHSKVFGFIDEYSDRVVKGPVSCCPCEETSAHMYSIYLHDPCYIELRHGSSANPIMYLKKPHWHSSTHNYGSPPMGLVSSAICSWAMLR
jgi:hypothetical protein